jgi:hypothetical protein
MPTGVYSRPSIEERFWKKVRKTKKCWLWVGGHAVKGYERIWFNGKVQPAARVCWQLYKGSIPDGLQVCHTCDNTSCVRLKHLFLGTPKENTQDMISKGRQRFPGGKRGEENATSILTWKKVRLIRRIWKTRTSKMTKAALGRRFNVDRNTIRQVVTNLTWRETV